MSTIEEEYTGYWSTVWHETFGPYPLKTKWINIWNITFHRDDYVYTHLDEPKPKD